MKEKIRMGYSPNYVKYVSVFSLQEITVLTIKGNGGGGGRLI